MQKPAIDPFVNPYINPFLNPYTNQFTNPFNPMTKPIDLTTFVNGTIVLPDGSIKFP